MCGNRNRFSIVYTFGLSKREVAPKLPPRPEDQLRGQAVTHDYALPGFLYLVCQHSDCTIAEMLGFVPGSIPRPRLLPPPLASHHSEVVLA